MLGSGQIGRCNLEDAFSNSRSPHSLQRSRPDKAFETCLFAMNSRDRRPVVAVILNGDQLSYDPILPLQSLGVVVLLNS